MPRLAALSLLLTMACFGDSTGPGEEPYSFDFADPAGDTAASVVTTDPKAIDLVRVAGHVDENEIELTLTFAEPVEPWTERAANSLDGFVYFDMDQASTGLVDAGRGMGIDFYLDLRDDGDGHLALVDVAGRALQLLSVNFDVATVTVKIPRDAVRLGTDFDNRFGMAVEIGVRGRIGATDLGPDADHYTLPPVTP